MRAKRFDELTPDERDEMIGIGLRDAIIDWIKRYNVRAGSIDPLYNLYRALSHAAHEEWIRAQAIKNPAQRKDSEIRPDSAALARLCYAFQRGYLSREAFVGLVMRHGRRWDSITRSTAVYPRVEATLERHFCEFWDCCEDEICIVGSETWEGWQGFDLSAMSLAADALGSVRLSRRFRVLKRDNYRCRLCGATADDGARLEVDHITARAKGGADTDDNLWTLCFECNRGKGTNDL